MDGEKQKKYIEILYILRSIYLYVDYVSTPDKLKLSDLSTKTAYFRETPYPFFFFTLFFLSFLLHLNAYPCLSFNVFGGLEIIVDFFDRCTMTSLPILKSWRSCPQSTGASRAS